MTLSGDRIKTLGAYLEKLRARFPMPEAVAEIGGGAGGGGGGGGVGGGASREGGRGEGEGSGEGGVNSASKGEGGLAGEVGVGGASAGGGAVGGGGEPRCCCHNDPVLRELVRSYLVWESTTPKAEAALKRIDQAVVDVNELRVCMPTEIAQIMGANYPKAEERATRLRATLNDLYRREHCLKLFHLLEKSRKESRAYLETLAAIPAFVAARVAVLKLGINVVPLDERQLQCLKNARAVATTTDLTTAVGMVEKAVKAADMPETAYAIQAWSDEAQTVVVKSVKSSASGTGTSSSASSATAASSSSATGGSAKGAGGKGSGGKASTRAAESKSERGGKGEDGASSKRGGAANRKAAGGGKKGSAGGGGGGGSKKRRPERS